MYISGKISGLTKLEVVTKFENAERHLIAQGYEVVNPVKLDHSKNQYEDWGEFMKVDIKALMDCDVIALLPCWHDSKGAVIEFQLSQHLKYPAILLSEVV